MQAYMKSGMPFCGVQSPGLSLVFRQVQFPPGAADWRAMVLDLWRGAKYREERYIALMLAGHRRARGFRTMVEVPLYEELVVTGRWWDLVDPVAPLLGEQLPLAAATLVSWAQDDDIWKRRAAIVAQRRLRGQVDAELLFACIEPSLGRPEFWLRKAIGWALREYAKTAPDAVRTYVSSHDLSPLSRREALKHL